MSGSTRCVMKWDAHATQRSALWSNAWRHTRWRAEWVPGDHQDGERQAPQFHFNQHDIFCFIGLSVHAQSELRASISDTISCTDASPSGGGSAIAHRFKSKSLVPEELLRQVCGCCGTDFRHLGRWGKRKIGRGRVYLHCMPRPRTSLVELKLVRIRPWDFEHSLRDVNLLEHWSCMFLACQLSHAQVWMKDTTEGKAVLRNLVGFVVCLVGLTFGIPYL